MTRIRCRVCRDDEHFWAPPERQRMRAYDRRFVELLQWHCLCQDCAPWCDAERMAVLAVPFLSSVLIRETTVPMPRIRVPAEFRPPRVDDDVPVLDYASPRDPRLFTRLLEGLRSL